MIKVELKETQGAGKSQHQTTKKVETPSCHAVISAKKINKIEARSYQRVRVSHTFVAQQKKQLSYFLRQENSDIDNALFTIKRFTRQEDN